MKKVNTPSTQALRPGAQLSADDYRAPRDRVITVKLPEPEYRSARNMARACRISVGGLVRGLILRTAERNRLLASDSRGADDE